MAEPRTPRCPLCGGPPLASPPPSDTQAFCADGACALIFWDPSLSRDAALAGAEVLHHHPTEGETP